MPVHYHSSSEDVCIVGVAETMPLIETIYM